MLLLVKIKKARGLATPSNARKGLVTPPFAWWSPLDNVVYRHYTLVRFVRTLLLVCNQSFERAQLRKHSAVGLKPVYNVATQR